MVSFNKAEVNAISNRISHAAICMACFRREPGLDDTDRDILGRSIYLLEEANKLLTGSDVIQIDIAGSFCAETPGALSALRIKDGRLIFTFTDNSLRGEESGEEE